MTSAKRIQYFFTAIHTIKPWRMRRCDIIAIDTTIQQRPTDIGVSNCRSLCCLQQYAPPISDSKMKHNFNEKTNSLFDVQNNKRKTNIFDFVVLLKSACNLMENLKFVEHLNSWITCSTTSIKNCIQWIIINPP